MTGQVGFLAGDFDDFYYEVHWESDVECEFCHCFCMNEDDVDDFACVPETLTLTITANTAYTCSGVDNISLTMYQSIPDTTGASPVFDRNPQKKVWYSETFQPGSEKMWFVMECEDGHYTLQCNTYPDADVAGAPANSLYFLDGVNPSEFGKQATTNLSTCVPFEQVFEDLTPAIDTCDLDADDPNYPGTGTRPGVCLSGDCWDSGEAFTVNWDVTVTE